MHERRDGYTTMQVMFGPTDDDLVSDIQSYLNRQDMSDSEFLREAARRELQREEYDE